jgi:hypothetical protein
MFSFRIWPDVKKPAIKAGDRAKLGNDKPGRQHESQQNA